MRRLFWIVSASVMFGNFHQTARGSSLPPTVSRVAIVIFENENYSDVLQNSYFNALAQKGALAINASGQVHPSQGNYIALTAGSAYGIHSDKNIDLDVRHIGDLLEDAGKTWKVYAEDYPGNCFLGKKSSEYVRKHNPFISFTNVQNDKSRCAKIVNADQLDRDIDSNSLPDFIFYVPNMKNDGHDTSVAYAADWFQTRFEPLMADQRFMSDTLLIATYDESKLSSLKNHIYTVLLGDMVVPGSKINEAINSFNLLRTVEEVLNLGDLGQNDASADAISGIWK